MRLAVPEPNARLGLRGATGNGEAWVKWAMIHLMSRRLAGRLGTPISSAEFEGPTPMSEKPILEVEATFLTIEQGGRKLMPDLGAGRYMPHLVVQPPEVRTAVVEGNVGVEDYLGVAFIAGPMPVVAGQPALFTIESMYHPSVSYESLDVGATFTIREGARVIGYGTVLRKR